MKTENEPGTSLVKAFRETVNGYEEATDYTRKGIGYAYASSTYANRYNGGEGFYFVEIYTPETILPAFGEKSLANPSCRFNTVEDAENAASLNPLEWSETYKRFPFPGSQFEP